jgi:glycosyltransferase AglE
MRNLTASVLIPVYNESGELEKVLNALEKQSAPRDTFEIIVIDNGSTDNTKSLVNRYDGVIYLLEDQHLKSPYSCRNRGIEISQGNVIVLLDGTCIPEEKWLEKGLECLETMQADIVSSNVRFDFRGRVTAGKLYDSNNLSTESAIREKGVAKTASLFIRKEVFDETGYFPEGVRSGADVRWTRQATGMGFKLDFCKDSVAWKKARTFPQSVKKQWRVGKGQPAIWKEEGIQKSSLKKFIRSLLPYHPKKVNKLAANKGVEVNGYLKFKLYFVAWFIWIVMSAGNMYGVYLMRKEKAENSGE